MDKATFGGIVVGIGGILAGLLIEGGSLTQIMQPTAAIIRRHSKRRWVYSSGSSPGCRFPADLGSYRLPAARVATFTRAGEFFSSKRSRIFRSNA